LLKNSFGWQRIGSARVSGNAKEIEGHILGGGGSCLSSLGANFVPPNTIV